VPAEELARLRARLPEAWFISAHAPADVAHVRDRIIALFEAAYDEAELLIPYDRQGIVSEMHDSGRVVAELYEEDDVHVTLRAEPSVLARFRARLAPRAP
jgi:GTPase